jgi:hypothetical protein
MIGWFRNIFWAAVSAIFGLSSGMTSVVILVLAALAIAVTLGGRVWRRRQKALNRPYMDNSFFIIVGTIGAVIFIAVAAFGIIRSQLTQPAQIKSATNNAVVGPPGPAGPPGPPGSSDERFRVALESALSVRRLQQLESNMDIIKASQEWLLQTKTDLEKTKGVVMGGHAPNFAQKMQSIATTCYPDTKFDYYEPTEVDIQTRQAPGEDQLTDNNRILLYRRSWLRIVGLTVFADQLEKRMESDITTIKQQIANQPVPVLPSK